MGGDYSRAGPLGAILEAAYDRWLPISLGIKFKLHILVYKVLQNPALSFCLLFGHAELSLLVEP